MTIKRTTEYICDLCGAEIPKADVLRVGGRRVQDRPEDADWFEIGPECHERPIEEFIDRWTERINHGL